MNLPGPSTEVGYFAEQTVTALAVDLRAGRTSPDELVEHALNAAARLNPLLNAFVTLDERGARAAARRATRELAADVDRGPLHGIPIAIKDVVDTAGLRTTMGSHHFGDRVPDRDATCVHRLREAGAIIIGKTTTHEFAYGPTGDRSANGAARNPYQPDHMAGGSSGGSAVAVAAGIVALSIGTDTGGSIRIPAACCGVVGLKPTHDAVPTDGVFPLSPSLDTVGPLARTAADCRLLWDALTGARSATDGETAAPTPARGVPLRVGWISPDSIHPTDTAVTNAVRTALEHVADGLSVREVDVPDIAALRRAYQVIQGSEVYAIHAERLAADPDLYDEEVLERLRAAGQVRGWELVRAGELRDRARVAITSLLQHQDLLALPTIPVPAPPLGTRSRRLADTTIDIRDALLSLTSPWSVVGLPAITVPIGLVEGLPVGLQLVGPGGSEALLLSVAQWLDDASHDRIDAKRSPISPVLGDIPRLSSTPTHMSHRE
jgi:aspartyl-tRNA(Asn)/glutamyl-tRNA(Gln) amidotransferase subunit A